MYHFSAPKPSINPPDEFELSLPLLCLPLVSGVEVPGGDIDKFGLCTGEDVPGDLESGGAYRCDGFEEKGRAVGVALDGEESICCACDSVPAFVVIVLVVDVAFVVVVETCAVETKEVGEMAEDGFDLA